MHTRSRAHASCVDQPLDGVAAASEAQGCEALEGLGVLEKISHSSERERQKALHCECSKCKLQL